MRDNHWIGFALICILVPALGCATIVPDTTADLGTDTAVPDVTGDGSVDPAVDDVPMETPDGGCPDGLTDCSGVCVDLTTDADNCGWCGNECPDTYENTVGVCVGSVCGTECISGWVDNDGLPGCETPCSGSGVEACNGIDDDCDTIADDGFECVMGTILDCVTTCGTYGTGTCSLTCTLPTAERCTPPAEECNGIDDDCDGATDEDFPPGTCGTCTPDCTGRVCGPDPVCATSCGTCTSPATCNAIGECVCIPDCGTRVCGPDPVCGLSCGTCTAPDTCDAWGSCACVPDCTGRVCGPDPVCSSSCGTCTGTDTCNALGQCISSCTPDCTGRVCGPDPVCGISCGTCGSGETCNTSGTCEGGCVPDCTGRDCGLDPVCYTSCGTCSLPWICGTGGVCTCSPDCSGRVCGPDPSCGESCGTCTAPAVCSTAGLCEGGGCPPPVASCTTGSESRDRCSGARTIGRTQAGISGGYSISDSTCYAEGRFNDCSWDAGYDHAYRLYMLSGETASIYTYADWACSWYSSSWWDLTLQIYGNAGCDATTCDDRYVCEDHIDSHTEVFTAPHDGWFIFVVDGSTAFDDEGGYDLTVTLTCNNASTCDC